MRTRVVCGEARRGRTRSSSSSRLSIHSCIWVSNLLFGGGKGSSRSRDDSTAVEVVVVFESVTLVHSR